MGVSQAPSGGASRRGLLCGAAALLALAGCGGGRRRSAPVSGGRSGRPEIDALISRHARHYGVPESLVHRVVKRESGYNPAARNGRYVGLMQLDPQTARTMGYRGPVEGLFDADTNLRYGVKYLRGAWLVAGGDHDAADRWYQRGYYYEAKRLGLLRETGLRS
ncbi:lytic transglycosylase domain-containing protein [Phaeovulum vinaykumarii]|uniref:Transglycosylase SLT domain-containing protein n=1 Tax=Phaeovulum vinaykumarii TaxID=407234 RepID=A0A1N7LKX2_9RHOB|nr:lytic transglycosylase domain-containing protein [Phaeovulum vinaykumarii]SIS74473.1 Transglycosylase SLT domain-containing protein [Phaeovulum vinaykumarii]SOC05046.1 transglycosylase-like protein with SLT domain [Phaeovulum vinaykumarii]